MTTGVMLAIWIVAIILAIIWICLPFAIFGTKPLLRQLIARQEETNRLLREAHGIVTPPRPTDEVLPLCRTGGAHVWTATADDRQVCISCGAERAAAPG